MKGDGDTGGTALSVHHKNNNNQDNRDEETEQPDKPGRMLEDVIVGPSIDERKIGRKSWTYSEAEHIDPPTHGSLSSNGGSKRRRVARSRSTDPSTFSNAIDTFLSSGCCVIPSVLPQHFVETCLDKAKSDLEFLTSELQQRRKEAGMDPHKLAAAHRVDYRELLDRDGLRRDVRYQLNCYPYTAPGLIYNSMVYPLVQKLLGGSPDVTLLYMGVM